MFSPSRWFSDKVVQSCNFDTKKCLVCYNLSKEIFYSIEEKLPPLFFLAVLLGVGENLPTDGVIKSVLSADFSEANKNQCRSISFSALKLTQNVIPKIINTFCDVILSSENQHVEVIRIVGDKKQFWSSTKRH